MRALQDRMSLADFFAAVGAATRRVLMLDYDGTLAPFHVDPRAAAPYAGVRELLDAIMGAGHTHLVIVSGRWTKDLLPLLGLKQRPEIWGSHGWEQLKASGEYDLARVDEAALRRLVAADDWAAQLEAKGARCEHKPGSLAIHWRGLPSNRIADIRQTVFENWRMQELHTHLQWHDFDGGIELRAPGRDKGDAVRAVLAETGADGAAAYLGDDLTDENAFQAIRGRGIGVLVRPQFRATAADFWMRPPEELLGFLTRWRHASEGGR
jgi:trehalose-phosphatase